MGWILNTTTNDIYTEDTVQDNVHVCYTAPYGNFLWSVNQVGNDIIPPGGGLSYHTPCFTAPFPSLLWYVTSNPNDVTHGGAKDYIEMGAFKGATNLTSIVIPRSVKRIGPEAFAGTGLTSVTIAQDCVYDTTSFPPGCIINFYS